jgi:hypothetical protein
MHIFAAAEHAGTRTGRREEVASFALAYVGPNPTGRAAYRPDRELPGHPETSSCGPFLPVAEGPRSESAGDANFLTQEGC